MQDDDLRQMGDLLFTTLNARDWDNALGLFGLKAVFHLGPLDTFQGHADARKVFAALSDSYDLRIRSWAHIAEDTRLATQAMMRLDYRKTQAGLPEAKGQVVDLPVAMFLDAPNGVFTRLRAVFSRVDWMNAIT